MREPATPSQPPGPETVVPMSPVAAAGWTMLATSLLIGAAMFVLAKEGESMTALAFARTGVCQIVAYLLTLFLILRVHAPKASIREVVGLAPARAGQYALALVAGVAAAPPVTLAYALIDRVLKEPPEQSEVVARAIASASSAERALLGLVILGVAPLVEEGFFRGALFGQLRRTRPAMGVAVTTSLLFAAVHLSKSQLLPLFAVGLMLASFRHASGSVGPSTMLHATFNAVSFAHMLWGATAAMPEAPNSTSYAVCAACAVVCGLALFASHKLGKPAPPSTPSIPPPPRVPSDS